MHIRADDGRSWGESSCGFVWDVRGRLGVPSRVLRQLTSRASASSSSKSSAPLRCARSARRSSLDVMTSCEQQGGRAQLQVLQLCIAA